MVGTFTVAEVDRMVRGERDPRRRLRGGVASRYALIVATADDDVAAQQAGGLSRGGTEERLAELEFERVALAVDAAGHGLGVVAQAHRVDFA